MLEPDVGRTLELTGCNGMISGLDHLTMRSDAKTRRAVLALLWGLGLVSVMLMGCALPKMPSKVSWDTEVSVPVTGRVYRLADIADNDSVLQANGSGIGMTLPDSALFFSYTKDITPIHPGDHLKLDPMDYLIDRPLDVLRIPLNFTQSSIATLGSLNPAVAAQNGNVMDVPPFPFVTTVDVPLGGQFSLACVDSGQVDVRITNTLPYAVDGTDIQLIADRDNSTTLYSGALSSGTDTSYSMSLAGRCLTNTTQLQIGGSAEGGSQILIDSTQGVSITISAGEILSSNYVGRLPRQVWAKDSLFALNQQQETHEGLISTGHLIVSTTNSTPFEDSIHLAFPNLLDSTGSPVSLQRFLNPGESDDVAIDLRGYTFAPDAATQRLRSRLETVALATDHDIEYHTGNQQVTSDFRTEALHFSRFNGVLHDLESRIEKDTTHIEQAPAGWENVHPAALDMRITLQGGMAAQGNLLVSMFSERQGAIIGSVNRSASVWLGHDTSVTFTNLEGLVPSLPDLIGDSGNVALDGPVTVYDTTTIRGSLEINAPLRFTLGNSHVPGTVEKVDPDPVDDVQEATLRLHLWNALPLSGTLRLIAAPDSAAAAGHSGTTDALVAVPETLCTVTLPRAPLVGGRVAQAVESDADVTPPEAFYDYLRNPPFYVRADLTLDASGNDTLVAYGSDYVKFSATARVRYRISSEH